MRNPLPFTTLMILLALATAPAFAKADEFGGKGISEGGCHCELSFFSADKIHFNIQYRGQELYRSYKNGSPGFANALAAFSDCKNTISSITACRQ